MEYIYYNKIVGVEDVFLVTINRPNVKNSLNSQVIQELTLTFLQLEKEKAGIVILQGAGKNFAAGADIKEMLNAELDELEDITQDVHDLHKLMNNSPIIFIAAIEGYCLGGGFELALACDIRIVSPKAVFGLPEVKLGILPGGWGTQKVLSLSGNSFAMKYILTGEFFSPEKALSVGIISDLAENPLQESKEVAKKIAINSRTSTRAIKKLLTGMEYSFLSDRYETERIAFKQLFVDGEAKEGLLAFTEKRKPNYQQE